ncbi:MAG TPA: secretin N-terminal domain-containing protein [Candidatus Tumulicola sp.]
MIRPLLVALACGALTCAGAVAASGTISIDVRDVDITQVIALLSAESGVNVVTDGSVKPERVTIHLHGVTFQAALRAIVDTHALQVRRENGILIVGATETMNRRGESVLLPLRHARPDDVAKELVDALPEGTVIIPDKRTASVVVAGDDATTSRARKLVEALDAAPFADATVATTKSYRLRFSRPDDLVAKLKTVVPDGAFIADEQQNAVLVTGGEAVQASAQSLIANVDRASPQVMFEVKVADVTPVNDASNFGLEFGGLDLQGQPIPGAIAYAFTNGTIPVNVRLNALVSKGRASILATPKLVTINNKEADLSIGETYPIVYSTSVLGGQNVQYVDIGVHLRLTPTIGTDGSVTAELHPEYSELVGFTPGGYPIVANRKIDSTLRVQDNETIVLGGLMRDTSSETVSKIPGLSDIPIIGKIFQNKSTAHERDEIVFLITPHVIYPGVAPPVR